MKTKVQITERALMQRIQRKLKHQDELLRKNASLRWQTDLGDFYIVDANRNILLSAHHNLEQLGRELGALRPYEELA